MHSFIPPDRLLLGPGPSNVPPRILGALARPTIGHLDPEFVRMMDELKGLLRRVVGKIFQVEIKGWCSEFETGNAADRQAVAQTVG